MERYPAVFPRSSWLKGSTISRGFGLWRRHCDHGQRWCIWQLVPFFLRWVPDRICEHWLYIYYIYIRPKNKRHVRNAMRPNLGEYHTCMLRDEWIRNSFINEHDDGFLLNIWLPLMHRSDFLAARVATKMCVCMATRATWSKTRYHPFQIEWVDTPVLSHKTIGTRFGLWSFIWVASVNGLETTWEVLGWDLRTGQ